MKHTRHIMMHAAAIALALMLFAQPLLAQAPDRTEPLPKELEGVNVVDQTGKKIPLDLTFTDETGKQVQIGEYFKSGRPVALTLVYFECPMLCTLVLNGQTEAMKQNPSWTPGEQYEVITVSFDPKDTPQLAAKKKKNYVHEYGKPQAAAGWHFLTGDEKNIKALADALGFQYRWDEKQQVFAHEAVIYIMSPDGMISRCLYDAVLVDPTTFRWSLVDAANGKVGSTLDRIVLTCFVYDPASGSYAASAVGIMRLGGVATVILLVAVVAGLVWIRKRRRAAGAG